MLIKLIFYSMIKMRVLSYKQFDKFKFKSKSMFECCILFFIDLTRPSTTLYYLFVNIIQR